MYGTSVSIEVVRILRISPVSVWRIVVFHICWFLTGWSWSVARDTAAQTAQWLSPGLAVQDVATLHLRKSRESPAQDSLLCRSPQVAWMIGTICRPPPAVFQPSSDPDSYSQFQSAFEDLRRSAASKTLWSPTFPWSWDVLFGPPSGFRSTRLSRPVRPRHVLLAGQLGVPEIAGPSESAASSVHPPRGLRRREAFVLWTSRWTSKAGSQLQLCDDSTLVRSKETRERTNIYGWHLFENSFHTVLHNVARKSIWYFAVSLYKRRQKLIKIPYLLIEARIFPWAHFFLQLVPFLLCQLYALHRIFQLLFHRQLGAFGPGQVDFGAPEAADRQIQRLPRCHGRGRGRGCGRGVWAGHGGGLHGDGILKILEVRKGYLLRKGFKCFFGLQNDVSSVAVSIKSFLVTPLRFYSRQQPPVFGRAVWSQKRSTQPPSEHAEIEDHDYDPAEFISWNQG